MRRRWLYEDVTRSITSFLMPRDALFGWLATGTFGLTCRNDALREQCAACLTRHVKAHNLGYVSDDDLAMDLKRRDGANDAGYFQDCLRYLTRELLRASGWRHNVFEEVWLAPYTYHRHPSIQVLKSVKSWSLTTAPIILNHPSSRPMVSAVYGCAMVSRRVRAHLKRSLLLRALVG